ncbi:hypothetical protein BN1708_012993, partial [Verticillium longisporum]
MRRPSGQQTPSPAKPSHGGVKKADPSDQGRAADGTIALIPINDVHRAIDTTTLNHDGCACCHDSDDDGLRKGSPPTRPGTPWSFSRQHAGTGASGRIADHLMPILEEEEEEGVDSPPVSAIGKDSVDDKEGQESPTVRGSPTTQEKSNQTGAPGS